MYYLSETLKRWTIHLKLIYNEHMHVIWFVFFAHLAYQLACGCDVAEVPTETRIIKETRKLSYEA